MLVNYCVLFVSCVGFCIVFFVFFKQKTAYEMRISDWSSDVCSSDLAAFEANRNRGLQADPDPVRQMLAAAMASKKDGDVEAVGKLAKQTSPAQLAELDAPLADYRARRPAGTRDSAEAARARVAQAQFWGNESGDG